MSVCVCVCVSGTCTWWRVIVYSYDHGLEGDENTESKEKYYTKTIVNSQRRRKKTHTVYLCVDGSFLVNQLRYARVFVRLYATEHHQAQRSFWKQRTCTRSEQTLERVNLWAISKQQLHMFQRTTQAVCVRMSVTSYDHSHKCI